MKVEYSAIAAKIKAIKSSCLSGEDYDELLSKNSVPEVYSYLISSTGYKSVLSELDKDSIHRGEIEKKLRLEMINEYNRIYSFMNLEQKKMFDFWFARREIEYLKRGLRYLYNHETLRETDDEEFFEEFFSKHTRLDCEAIKNASTLDQFIEACKKTPYAAVLERSQNISADFFSISMMLDSCYYRNIWKAKDKHLKGSDRKTFEKIIGAEIDMHNIIWIYRSKKYFNMSPEITVTYLMPIRYRLSEETVKMLVSAPNADDVVRIVSGTAYKELFANIENDIFPEENMSRIDTRIAKSVLRTEPQSMAAVYAYFDLKDYEIFNITTILESIRYSLDRQTIRRHINVR